jgi:hypothetical protein
MRETIKKILKEQTDGSRFTKFELHVLNYMYKKVNGEQLNDYIKNDYQYGKFLRELKNLFALDNKLLSEIIYLYKYNWASTYENGFHQIDDVDRKKAKKWKVSYYHDVTAWAETTWETWGTDEDDAYRMTDAADQIGDDSLVISKEYGDTQVGDWGEVYDSEITPLEESIKRELSLLKEDHTNKLSDKLLINVCKNIYIWLGNQGYDEDDIDSGWVYGELLREIMSTYALSEDMVHYLIAVYLANHERINKDWSELLVTGIDKPKVTTWNGTKEYGASQWVTDIVSAKGYSEAQVNYYNYEGWLDWETESFDTMDTWDEDTEWERSYL